MSERWEETVKKNQQKADAELVPLMLKIPAAKYRALMELARKTGRESLTFIRGEPPFDCEDCPVRYKYSLCPIDDEVDEILGDGVAGLICYGVFMRFLLGEV